MPSAPVTAHRRFATGVIALALIVVAACSSGSGSASDGSSSSERKGGPGAAATTTTTASTTTTTAPQELPGGGRKIFPARRVVGYYGNAQAASLGVLGETGPLEAADRVLAAAAPFDQPDRPVLGAFELIVSVAQRAPGPDGDFSTPTSADQIRPWLYVARARGLLLILDIQSGRGSFVDEVKRYEEFLRLPDVGLGLDPEWRMGPDEIPGKKIGSVTAAEVNEVSAWLADIVKKENLPEKLFILHQFTQSMITGRETLVDRPGLETVIHVDGFGGRAVKLSKYDQLHAEPPFYNGLKLFYDEDTDIFQPADVLALQPTVDLITYQ